MKIKIDLTQDKIKRNVFFTSDFHCYHNNVIKFDNRPFIDINEMHNVLENNWNEVVSNDDIVIYLGDLSFARREDKQSVDEFLYRLNGHIHYVIGNHDDYREIIKNKRFDSVQDYLEIKLVHIQDNKRVEDMFVCMHYPIYSWNKSHYGSWLIHGHCHMGIFNEEEKWFSKMNNFSEYIPKEKLEEYNSLIKERKYYNKRVFDVGCMGWDYKPVSYLDILKLGEHRNYGIHH